MVILMKVLHMSPTFGIVLSLLNKFLSKFKCKVSTFMLIKEFTWSHSPTHTYLCFWNVWLQQKGRMEGFCWTHAASILQKLWPTFSNMTRAQAQLHIDTDPCLNTYLSKRDGKTGVRHVLSPFVNKCIPVDKVQGYCAFSLPVGTSSSCIRSRLHDGH